MAIYHLSVNVISRSEGRSSTGAAAYRSAISIKDERTGIQFNYTNKKGVDSSEILAPEHSPHWVFDRNTLWNTVEQVEKRKDAQLCREVEVALPVELTFAQKQRLVRDFAQREFVQHGMIADISIHHADSHNPHAHILLTLRDIGPEGFGQKQRDWNRKELLVSWREAWEKHANLALEQAQQISRIDHRTLEAQQIDRVPQIHLGPRIIEMETRGIQTERGERALTIENINTELTQLQTYREGIEHECDHAAQASQKRRTVSERDRTFSSESRESRGRDSADPTATNSSKYRASQHLEQTATGSRSNFAANSTALYRSSTTIETSSRSRPSRDLSADLVSVHHRDSQRRPSGGAYERVLALGSPPSSSLHDRSQSSRSNAQTRTLQNPEKTTKVNEPDFTYLAVRRQLLAMKCEHYEVGVRRADGKMLTRTWSSDEVLHAVPWLKRENAKGADIYLRPAGETHSGIVLLDDLSRHQVERLKTTGYAPAAVVETSPMNYQAWVRVSDRPLAPKVASVVSKTLALSYEADPNSADWRHFGRLAGFTNRKPEHTTSRGYHPWVMCHEATGQSAKQGHKAVQKAQHCVFEREVRAEYQERIKTAQNALESVYSWNDPVREYRQQLKQLMAKYGSAIDFSRADYMICSSLAKQGHSGDTIRATLQAASPELSHRKLGHEADYCDRTVRAVFNDPEVQERRQALQREGPSLSL